MEDLVNDAKLNAAKSMEFVSDLFKDLLPKEPLEDKHKGVYTAIEDILKIAHIIGFMIDELFDSCNFFIEQGYSFDTIYKIVDGLNYDH